MFVLLLTHLNLNVKNALLYYSSITIIYLNVNAYLQRMLKKTFFIKPSGPQGRSA